MEKYYKVQFIAHLHRLTLALKMNCKMQVIWKRGEKVAESPNIQLINGEALFDKKLQITCNMIYNDKDKMFGPKITKFLILLFSEKGVKQAGEIEFDVAEYVNEKQLHRKTYDLNLMKCPDKKAKLSFTINGSLKEQIEGDEISQLSYTEAPRQSTLHSTLSLSQNILPLSDKEREKTETLEEKIKQIQNENKRMREEIAQLQKVKKENRQLQRKLQNQQYPSVKEWKKRVEACKIDAEKVKKEIKKHQTMQRQNYTMEEQILKCKVKIMQAFNYAADFGGSQLVDRIQQFCGIQEF